MAKSVIFFTEGLRPTAEEIAEAEGYSTDVTFRAAAYASPDELEEADAVAGKVPQHYIDAKGVGDAPRYEVLPVPAPVDTAATEQ